MIIDIKSTQIIEDNNTVDIKLQDKTIVTHLFDRFIISTKIDKELD